MREPLQFYTEEKEKLETEFTILKKKILQTSIVRLLAFLTICASVYLIIYGKTNAVFATFIGFVLFVFFIVKYVNLQRKKDLISAKIKINTTEIEVLNRDFHSLETGEEFINPAHYYSNDIDLFGIGSFFQYINRAVTDKGKKLLAHLLLENSIENIEEKQEALKELSEKIKWRQHFSALASLVSVKKDTNNIASWLHNYNFRFSDFIAFFPKIFGLISVVLIGLLSFSIISFSVLVIWFFIGLGITAFFFKKVQTLYTETDKVRETFKQYHQLLNEIENETFTSKFLVEKQKIIQSENKKASLIFKEFSKVLDAFDQRNNIVIVVFGNALFLWDINNAGRVEKWIKSYKHTVEQWFDVVAFFDAQNSLANFKYNHPKFIFPKITTQKSVINGKNIGHPLLDSTKRIDNDFVINKEQFFIVTGANMAGKSTFLRTVSLSIVMTNCGLPVCAEEFKYSPIKLITSMRTSDSLTEDESYFYSELKRLKFIVDEIENEDYFIILDEILKGTNSKDKAIGSKKFVEKLSNSKSTGIIATHDVSLCDLSDEFKDIENYYFDAEIIEDELHFDYTLKNGICKNMNASFLLKKMKIV